MSVHGPRLVVLAIQLRRGEARRVHRLEARRFRRERLPRGTEVEQDRRAVLAQIDVARLDVEVQQLVDVDLAQPAHQVMEDLPDEAFAQHLQLALLARAENMLLQRFALLVRHHHVHRAVFPEEIEHAHDGRMGNLGERPAFLEEVLEPEAECACAFLGHDRDQLAGRAPGERRRQVFLDGYRRPMFIGSEIDEAEPPAGQLLYNAIIGQQRADR